MAITARLINDDRMAPRFPVDLDATLRDTVTRPHDVSIEDLSHTGFRLTGAPAMAVGADVSIGFAGIGVHQARVMRRDGDSYGCEFVAPITPDMLAQARNAAEVVPIAFPATSPYLAMAEVPAPHVQPYPRHTRMMMMIAAPVVLWGAIAAVYIAL